MDVKGYLRSMRRYDVMIQRKMDELAVIKSSVIYSSPMLGDNVHGSSNPHKKEDAILKMVELEKYIGLTIIKLTELKSYCIQLIDTLEDASMIDIMYRRYFSNEKWEDIAKDMGITTRWVLKLHGEGLVALSEKNTLIHFTS